MLGQRFAIAAMATLLSLQPVLGAEPQEISPVLTPGAAAGDEAAVFGIDLHWCPPGRFIMGSPPDEPERRPGEDQAEVTLTQGFWMGKFEVTQGLWKRVMGTLPGPADKGEGDDFPVYNCTFFQTQAFCKALTDQARAAGVLPADWRFRLPTEAEWEYACRAGTTDATPFGPSLGSHQANFLGNFPYNGAAPGPALNQTCEVGQYPANPWGLHDMLGNVFEWCSDWYHPQLPGGADPDLSSRRSRPRVRRGGCWADEGWPCRSAFRLKFEPERGHSHIGFRVVAAPDIAAP